MLESWRRKFDEANPSWICEDAAVNTYQRLDLVWKSMTLIDSYTANRIVYTRIIL